MLQARLRELGRSFAVRAQGDEAIGDAAGDLATSRAGDQGAASVSGGSSSSFS
jgi:hypothetical protein